MVLLIGQINNLNVKVIKSSNNQFFMRHSYSRKIIKLCEYLRQVASNRDLLLLFITSRNLIKYLDNVNEFINILASRTTNISHVDLVPRDSFSSKVEQLLNTLSALSYRGYKLIVIEQDKLIQYPLLKMKNRTTLTLGKPITKRVDLHTIIRAIEDKYMNKTETKRRKTQEKSSLYYVALDGKWKIVENSDVTTIREKIIRKIMERTGLSYQEAEKIYEQYYKPRLKIIKLPDLDEAL